MVKAITTNHMATCKAIPHICRTTAVAMDNVSAVLCLVITVTFARFGILKLKIGCLVSGRVIEENVFFLFYVPAGLF